MRLILESPMNIPTKIRITPTIPTDPHQTHKIIPIKMKPNVS